MLSAELGAAGGWCICMAVCATDADQRVSDEDLIAELSPTRRYTLIDMVRLVRLEW
jgi:hypothetical protein